MSRRSRGPLRIILAAVVTAALLACPAYGQTLASVNVTVQDPAGAMVRAAKVVLRSTQTGFQRSVETAESGTAQVLNVPPGEYELRVEAGGFRPNVRPIHLEVGQVASATVTLVIAASTEVSVSAEVEGVDTYKSQISEVLAERQIETLPIKGRNFIDFVMLTPKVTLGNSTSVGSQAPFTEQTPKLSFSGVRETHSVLITLDNVDYTTGLSGLQRASPAQDWVREFRAVTGTYDSDVGRTLGGTVNSVTKSGTNDVHGQFYEFFRNNELNAKNPLASDPKDTLRMNQFGAFIGGPIAKDKAFFFAGYEGQRRGQAARYSSFINTFIESAPGCPVLAPGIPPAPGCVSINATKRFFDLQPEDLRSVLMVNNYDKLIGKLDYQISSATTLTTRYLFSDERNHNSPGAPPGLGLPSTFRDNPIRDQSVAADIIHTFSNTLTGDTVLQFGRRTFHLDPIGAGREPFMAIPNLVQSGGPVGSFTFYQETRLQVAENISWALGRHTLKFGAEFHNLWNSTKSPMFTPGVSVFEPDGYFGVGLYPQPTAVVFYFAMPRSLYESGTPLIARGNDWESSLLPPTAQFEEFDAASSAQFQRRIFGIYLQDQWRVTPRFVLTLGLRYDLETRPFSDRGWYQSDNNNFQPRIGFAFAFNDKTVLRGGAGIYTGPFNWSELVGTTTAFGPITGYMNNPNVPAFVNPSQSLVDLAYYGPVGLPPGPFTSGPAFDAFVRTGTYPALGSLLGFSHGFTTRDFPNPYAENASLQLERSLGRDVQVSIGYSFMHALKLHYFGHANAAPCVAVSPFCPTGATLPNGKPALQPADLNFGFAFLDSPEAYSIYHGGFVTVNKRFRNHFSFNANYTWSKSIDNQTTIQFATGPQNYLRKEEERGVSDNHVGHRLVATALFESPSKNAILRDWSFGLTETVQSGRYQPVLVGFDVNGDGFPFSDRVGLLGRNSYRGDAFRSTDIRVERGLPFTAGSREVRTTFSLEVFNLFNRTNVLDVDNIYLGPDLVGPEPTHYGDGVGGAIPQSGFGRPRSIADMRQLQLSVRFSF